MQELLNQIQSPAWWIGGVILTIAGNLVWALLVWLRPHAVRSAVPVARGMLCACALATVVAGVYAAVMAPEGFQLMGPPMRDDPLERVMFATVVSISAIIFPTMIVLFGPPSAQLVVAAVLSCWAGLVVYAATMLPMPEGLDLASTRLLLGAYIYALFGSGLALVVPLPFLPFIVRAMTRHLDAREAA